MRSPDEADAIYRGTGERYIPAYHYSTMTIALGFTVYHLYAIACLVRNSVRASELVFVETTPRAKVIKNLLLKVFHVASDCLERCFSRATSRLRRFVLLYGIRGPFFERTFHAKEVYEILLQSFQLYRTLYHVVDPSASYLATAVVTLKCLTTPIIYTSLPHPNHRANRFLLCLVVDATLDHISSVAIPLTVYGKYRDTLNQPRYFDASWTFFTGSSLVQFVPNSLLLAGSRTLPSLSMAINLHAIKSVVKRRKRLSATVSERAHFGAFVLSVRPATTTQRSYAESSIAKPAPPATSIRASRHGHPRWVKLLHAYFVVHGLAAMSLLFVGTRDAVREGLPDCKLMMARWLVPRVPCAVMEIDCGARNLSGAAEPAMVALLARLDPNALRALAFVGCPALVVPDAVRGFRRLHWLEIRDSTLVAWPRSAALTRDTTPRFSRLHVLETNVTEFPRVLDDAALPRTLLDVTFAGTNLSDLPDTLHAAWPQPMISLFFERCGFTRVPATLRAMRVDALSLAGNAIRDVPPWLLDGKTFSLLSLAANPIEQLPATAAGMALRASPTSTRPRGLWLAGTRVAALPAWACALRGDVVATGSPLCEAGEPRGCPSATASPVRCAAPASSALAISAGGFLFSPQPSN